MMKDEALMGKHRAEAFKVRPTGQYDPNAKRFVCPASGIAITEATCRTSRSASPAICINCLIPLDHVHCEECGRRIPEQEARAGFTTCEFCGQF